MYTIYQESFGKGCIPEDWTDSFMRHIPNRERPQQDEWIPHLHNAGHRCRASETRCCQENAAAFAYDVYEGFQRKEQTAPVEIDLEDAYNRVHFKLLMELLMQYGVSLTLTRWTA